MNILEKFNKLITLYKQLNNQEFPSEILIGDMEFEEFSKLESENYGVDLTIPEKFPFMEKYNIKITRVDELSYLWAK